MRKGTLAFTFAFGLAAALSVLVPACGRHPPGKVGPKAVEPAAPVERLAPAPADPTHESARPAAAADEPAGDGRLSRINGYSVLHLSGTPEQMGEQHGRLLKPVIKKVIEAAIRREMAYSLDSYKRLIAGARVMEKHLPDAFRRELKALAAAADVPYDEVAALQLFGDVSRSSSIYCSTYAVFGKATATGECFAGRNMDYWDYGVMSYAAVLIHFRPDEGVPFVTVSWAGIINGWTAMNVKGIVVANNTGYGARANSQEGISTCFMLRKVAQFCDTVEAGVKTIQQGPRACGTVMLVAGGAPPNAAEVEYDHKAIAVRWAKDGYVLGTNHFRTLYEDPPLKDTDGWCVRYQSMLGLIKGNYGQIDDSMNFTADPKVYMGINLHSAWFATQSLCFHLAMGPAPAAEGPFEAFRLTPHAIVGE